MALDELEQLVMSQRYLAARELFRKVGTNGAFTDPALAYHLMSVAEAGLGNYLQAVGLAQLADTFATQICDWSLVARIGANLIELLRLVGESGLALERGQRWLSELVHYPEMKWRRGGVEYNLALVSRDRGDASTARRMLENATQHMCEDGEEPAYQVMPWLMLAWVCYESEDFISGDEAYHQAETIMPKNADRYLVRELLLLKAHRAFYALDYDTALELVEEFVVPNTVTTPIQKLAAVWIAGMTAAKLGRLTLAKEMAKRLQDLNMDGDMIISPRHANGATEILRRVKLTEDLMGAGDG